MHGPDGGSEIGGAAGQMLPHGYRLDEYEIDKCIGSGGFGITYLGTDVNLHKKVAIKEYFPSHLAFRGTDSTVAPRTQAPSDLDEYAWGLERFVDEARTLAKFEHPNVIRVLRYIEENSTAYIVMDFAQGKPLNEFMKAKGPLSCEDVSNLVFPLMDGLSAVHEKDMLHRDVKPQNIIIKPDGTPVLIDFGAARNAIGSRSKSLSAILTPHFAPIEQYSTHGNQGPWTDIYALGAVAYQCLSGEKPPEATERVRKDPIQPIALRAAGAGDPAFLAAIDWALSPNEEDRPQSVNEWRTRIQNGGLNSNQHVAPSDADDRTIVAKPNRGGGKSDINPPANADKTVLSNTPGEQRNRSVDARRSVSLIVGVIGIAAVTGLLYLAFGIGRGDGDTDGSKPGDQPATISTNEENPTDIQEDDDDENSESEVLPFFDSAESEAFDNAREINTAEAMEIYLRLYPDGPNADAARERLTALRNR